MINKEKLKDLEIKEILQDFASFHSIRNQINIFSELVENYVNFKLPTKKQPLFTTEDGVEIMKYDKTTLVYKVRKENFTIISNYAYQYSENSIAARENKLYSGLFSTKEVAEEYILMNKPCLSIKEIFSLLKILDNGSNENYQSGKLRKLVKSKLK